MMTNSTLTSFLNEKDVENFYRQLLTKKFGDIVFNSPFGCDGYGESKNHNVRLLCEFKDDLDLTSKVNQVKVLCQALYYIKKFELSGRLLPSVILIADRNECFTIHTNDIFNYLGMDFDWDIAPSNAHTNIELFSLMIEDGRINPHVFNIKDIADCVDKIKDLTDGVKRLIPITPHNVTEVFKHFEDKVIGKHNLDTNQIANLFVQLLVNPDDNYLHPITRRKTVVTNAFHEVNLKSREVFQSFFSHFSREYTPKQREHLTAVVDRLVQDVTRRKQGEFFTPSLWAGKANEFISKISESRLDSIMKKYLDSYLLGRNIINNQLGITIYDDEEDYLQYFLYKKELFILNEFLDDFESMFSISRTKSLTVISEWFENEFHVTVNVVG